MGANLTLIVAHERAWRIYDYMNKRYFRGKLRLDEIEIDRLDTEVGYCVYEDGRYVIGLTDDFEDDQQFISTLFHEMVHLYQYQRLAKEPDHGFTFDVWRTIAKLTGLDFSVYA